MLAVVAVLLGLVEQQLARALLTLEVRVACMDELVHREVVVFEHTLLHGGDGVGQVRRARDVHAAGGVTRTALLHRLTALHAAPRYHGGEDDGVAVHMDGLHEVVPAADGVVAVEDLRLEGVLELLDVRKVARVAGLEPHKLARGRVDAVVQHELDHLAHVHVASVGRSVGAAAAGACLDAAHDGPVTRLLDGAALAQGHLDGGLVVEEAGVGLTFLNHLAAKTDELLGGVLKHAQGHDGLRGLQGVGRLQAQQRQIVGGVLALGGLASHHEDLPHGVAGKRGGVPVVAHLVHVARLEVEALEHLKRLVAAQGLIVQHVLLVEGPHVLVEAAKAARRGAHLDIEVHVHEPHHLKCLVKGLRRVFGHYAAVLGYLTQLGGALGVGALLCHAVGLNGHTVGIGDERLGLNDACAPEVDLRLLLTRLRHGCVDVALAFLNVAAHAHGEDLLVIARRLSGNAVLEAHADDVVVLEVLNPGRHGLVGDVLHGLALPIGQRLQNGGFVLGGDVVRILLAS